MHHPSYSLEQVKFASVSAASSGDNTLLSAVSGKRIRVLDYVLVGAGAVTAKFESSTSGPDLSGAMTLSTGVPNAPGFSPAGHFQTDAGALLNLVLGGAVQVSGYLVYQEV